VIVGHAIPGAAIGRRALGAGRYVAKIHGSDLEYAIRAQDRYRELAREGLGGARAVLGAGAEVLERCAALVPEMRALAKVVRPGVDVATFRPRPRAEALREAADGLDADPDARRGRPAATEEAVERALAGRDLPALDAIATTYPQDVPEPGAAASLRALAGGRLPIVGYLGKLIPQKGVELFLAAHRSVPTDSEALVVGFGSSRDRLAALAIALQDGDDDALAWLRDATGLGLEELPSHAGGSPRITFTGRLDHRYAPQALASMDVQVVPSILSEAFGMVAAEGAAAGALPLVARHSGLAEVAAALEGAVDRPGLFSYEPGEGAVARIAAGIERLLSLPGPERDELRGGVSAFVRREWSWERTAGEILDAV
jgi:glycosyltransferase involved in cell wall biosynthesis